MFLIQDEEFQKLLHLILTDTANFNGEHLPIFSLSHIDSTKRNMREEEDKTKITMQKMQVVNLIFKKLTSFSFSCFFP